MLVWEDCRDWAWCHCDYWHITQSDSFFCEYLIIACINIGRRNCKFSITETFELSKQIREVFYCRACVKKTLFIHKCFSRTFWPIDPDILSCEILPSIWKKLWHFYFISNIETSCSSSIDPTCRHSSDYIPSEILWITIMSETPNDSCFPCSVVCSSTHCESSALIRISVSLCWNYAKQKVMSHFNIYKLQ